MPVSTEVEGEMCCCPTSLNCLLSDSSDMCCCRYPDTQRTRNPAALTACHGPVAGLGALLQAAMHVVDCVAQHLQQCSNRPSLAIDVSVQK